MRNLVSFNFNSTSYNRRDYRTKLMGTSDCNMFIPFYALFAHELLMFEDTNTSVMEYSLPGTSTRQAHRQYNRMLEVLVRSSLPCRYNYRFRGIDYSLNMHKGLLYKEDTIYLCLGINSEYIINMPVQELENLEQLSSRVDSTKLTLFVSNDFDTAPELKNIRKKVQQMYIDPLRAAGVDVVQTSRINSWLFNNNYETPKFKNVVQMMKHLQEEVPKTLLI